MNVSQGEKLSDAILDIRFWLIELKEIATDPQERASLRYALHQIHDELMAHLPTLRDLSEELSEEADIVAGGDGAAPVAEP